MFQNLQQHGGLENWTKNAGKCPMSLQQECGVWKKSLPSKYFDDWYTRYEKNCAKNRASKEDRYELYISTLEIWRKKTWEKKGTSSTGEAPPTTRCFKIPSFEIQFFSVSSFQAGVNLNENKINEKKTFLVNNNILC